LEIGVAAADGGDGVAVGVGAGGSHVDAVEGVLVAAFA
jgi:hypothetical protein